MATLAIGIVGGDMPWPLVVVGIFFGIAMIMMQVRSPMLVAVGMYLPFETTFAIFLGGVFRALGDWLAKRRGFNEAQKARVENAGVLTASGLIAGEVDFWAYLGGIAVCPPIMAEAPQLGNAITRRRYSNILFIWSVEWSLWLCWRRLMILVTAHECRRSERTGAADGDDVDD